MSLGCGYPVMLMRSHSHASAEAGTRQGSAEGSARAGEDSTEPERIPPCLRTGSVVFTNDGDGP
eukprot:4009788-Prymnesium_polylepis.1